MIAMPPCDWSTIISWWARRKCITPPTDFLTSTSQFCAWLVEIASFHLLSWRESHPRRERGHDSIDWRWMTRDPAPLLSNISVILYYIILYYIILRGRSIFVKSTMREIGSWMSIIISGRSVCNGASCSFALHIDVGHAAAVACRNNTT